MNRGEWAGLDGSLEKGVDPSEIAVINMLKGKLAEMK